VNHSSLISRVADVEANLECRYVHTLRRKRTLTGFGAKGVAALMSAASGDEAIVMGSSDEELFCLVAFCILQGPVKKGVRPEQ
jgi:hypothetical protein